MTNIIIVEDNSVLTGLFREALEGVEALNVAGTARDGNELFDILDGLRKRDENPDVIIMDYGLPGSNGLDILPKVRAEHPHCRVIITSGDSRVAGRAMEEGADIFLLKPFGIDQLIHAVTGSPSADMRKP